MGGFFARPAVRAVAIMLIGSAVLGAGAALFFARPQSDAEQLAPPSEEEAPAAAFGNAFLHFFLGRTADGTRPSSNTQLSRASTFFAGEEAGLRAQTAPGQTSRLVVELRFLDRATREEKPDLQSLRQRITIRPGLHTYCCVRLPKTPGQYTVGVLMDERYVTYLSVEVRARPVQQSGGLQLGL